MNIISCLKKNVKIIILGIAIILICIIRQTLVNDIPIKAKPNAGEDDYLMIELAQNLLSNSWLGEYNYHTLMKGPIFPMMLVLLNNFHIQYIFFVTLLYILSCIIFVFSIRKFIKNKIVFTAFFTILLFNPIMLCNEILQRVYRNVLTPTYALLLTSGYIAIFIRKNEKIRNWIFWIILEAITLPMFYYTREDTVWIVPFIIFMIISTILALLYSLKNKLNKNVIIDTIIKTILLIIPIISLILFGNWIANKNYENYGFKVKNVLTDSNFTDALIAIYSVKPNEDYDRVTITIEKIDRMAKASPSFNKIAEKMRELFLSFGRFDSNPDDNQLEDGWVLWAIRQSAAKVTNNLADEQELYKNIAIELNDAIDKGILERQATMPSPMMSPWKKRYTPQIIDNIIESFCYVASFRDINDIFTVTAKESGTVNWRERISEYEKLLPNDKILYTYEEDNTFTNYEAQDIYKESISNKIKLIEINNTIYRNVGMFVFVLGSLGYIFITTKMIVNIFKKNRGLLEEWVVISGVLGAAFTIIVGIAYNNLATAYSIKPLYLCGVYPLIIVFECLSIIVAGKEIKKIVSDIIKSKNEKKQGGGEVG